MTVRPLFVVCCASLALAAGNRAPATPASAKSVRIEILYTQNTNGVLENCDCPGTPLGGLDKRLTLMKRLANRDSVFALYLDAGDLLSSRGFPLKDEFVLRAYSIIGYDAIAIGDQEFVNGARFLSDVNFHLHLPFTSCCLKARDSSIINPLSRVIKAFAGIRIGIVGIIGAEAFMSADSENTRGVILSRYTSRLKEELTRIRNQVDVVVVLSHLGYNDDVSLAKEFPAINVIIGAHSNTLKTEPERIGNTYVVQAGKNSEFVGQLTLLVDRSSKAIRSLSGTVHPVMKDIAGDERLAKLLAQYDKEVATDVRDSTPLQQTPAHTVAVEMSGNSCKGCHQQEWRSWSLSGHALAYESLVKRRAGMRPECLPCHTADSSRQPASELTLQSSGHTGVACLSCHQVSRAHLDHGKGSALKPTLLDCVKCHTPGTQPVFDVAASFTKISHTRHRQWEYVVKKDDSLSRIARRLLSNPNQWNLLYRVNRGIIKNPDLIYPYQHLAVPGGGQSN